MNAVCGIVVQPAFANLTLEGLRVNTRGCTPRLKMNYKLSGVLLTRADCTLCWRGSVVNMLIIRSCSSSIFVPVFVQFAVILCSLCEGGNVAEIFFFLGPPSLFLPVSPGMSKYKQFTHSSHPQCLRGH